MKTVKKQGHARGGAIREHIKPCIGHSSLVTYIVQMLSYIHLACPSPHTYPLYARSALRSSCMSCGPEACSARSSRSSSAAATSP
jgi:hypothetical protein